MLIPNVDKIVLALDVVDYENNFEDFLKYLEIKKLLSKEISNNRENVKAKITILSDEFLVYPTGTKSHAYILESYNYKFYFAQKRSRNENFYPIKIDVFSSVLWSKSPKKAYEGIFEHIDWIKNKFNSSSTLLTINEKVSRVDLCCHTDEFSLTEESIVNFQGRYKKHNLIFENKKLQTFFAGSRKSPLVCRIYNKTAEVENNAKKSWFYEIWYRNKFDLTNVWNIEFELHREFLNEISNEEDIEFDTFIKINEHAKVIWEYCTKEWLVYKDFENTRIERCPVNEQWVKIQNAFNNYNDKRNGYITRLKQLKYKAKYLIPTIIGYITSFASMYPDMGIDEAFEAVKFSGILYLEKKDSNFQKEIDEKRKLNIGGLIT